MTEAPESTTEVVHTGYPSPTIHLTLELQTTEAVLRPVRPGKPGQVISLAG